MPLVWEVLPDLKITIIGSEAPLSISKMNSKNFRSCRLCRKYYSLLRKVLCLRLSSTVWRRGKGKIGQTLEYTLPVLTTDIGAEGMFLENGITALISENEDYQKFADNIIEICTNESTSSTLHNNSEKAIYPFSIEAQKDEIFQLLQ